jgi:hypothetical protein
VRFKVDELSFNEEFSIPYGALPEQYNLKFRKNFPVNLPSEIYFNSDRVFLPNLEKGHIKILSKGGKLEMIIGRDLQPEDPKNKNLPYKIVAFPLSQVVRIIPGPDNSFYVQNRLTPEQKTEQVKKPSKQKKKKGKQKKPSPYESSNNTQGWEFSTLIPYGSNIIHFNEEGELISSIGQRGKNSAPFGYVEKILVDDEERLIVLHHFGLEKVLIWFDKKGKVIKEVSESNLNISLTEDDKQYTSEIENIIPFPDGEHFLASIAYRDKNSKGEIQFRLKYRKIIKYSLNNPKNGTLILEISDPRETLFWTTADYGFYIWQNENTYKSIRLQVYNKEGTHINNKMFRFPNPTSFWRQIYADLDENIISLFSDGKKFSIYTWR